MDEDTAEQIRMLLTLTGMIMEDNSAGALTLSATDAAFVEQLDGLARAIDAASILLRAAALLYADGLQANGAV